MPDHRGWDAEYPPTNPVPSEYEFAGIYDWGVNVARITPLSEQRALQAAGYRLFAYGVGQNSCPGCTSANMTAAQGTADGHAFAAITRLRGLRACCFDWEAGGDKNTGRPSTQLLPGFLAYATAAAQAVHDDGLLVGHYGTPEILGALMPAENGHVIMDFIVLTRWTNTPVDDAVTLWWRARFPLFCWQYGGADPLDYLICNQAFFDALGGDVAGPEQPVTDHVYFPNYGGHTIGGGIFQSWTARGGLAGPGLPLNDEHPFTGDDGKQYTAQDFERGRAEWAADVQEPFNVQWGLVDLELLTAKDEITRLQAQVEQLQAQLANVPKPIDLTAVKADVAQLVADLAKVAP